MPDTPIHSQQRRKNIALMLVLIALIVLVYAITVMRIGSRV